MEEKRMEGGRVRDKLYRIEIAEPPLLKEAAMSIKVHGGRVVSVSPQNHSLMAAIPMGEEEWLCDIEGMVGMSLLGIVPRQ